MLHAAILCLFVGQVPPPPAPLKSEQLQSHASGDRTSPTPQPKQSDEQADLVPPDSDPKVQRDWLLAHLMLDLHAQGKLDAKRRQDIERMVNNVSDSQIAELVKYYQAQELAQAQANLRRLQAYRDALRKELAWKTAISRQEQAMAAAGPALSAQQGQWVVPNIYAAPPTFYAAPYYAQPYAVNRPYGYGPRYYHRHW
jgi:hypothetical protein